MLTPTEASLAVIWTSVLGTPVESPDTDFFDSGGDSFLATKVVVTVRQQWRIEVAVDLLLENTTLRELAWQIDEFTSSEPVE
ncbi:hypothetical protein A8W25_01235 [Streptomyces sp. ERV7]|nr:hypothetical protein A8W25_01235 [Streptomyces sp. ERV7]